MNGFQKDISNAPVRDRLRASLSQWYRPGTDNFIYERVLRECRASNASLARFLPPDDVLLLSGKSNGFDVSGFDAKTVRVFIEEKAQEAESQKDRSKIKWLSSATNTFAKFALNIQDLLNPLVPQSPEFAIPYGCLMVIFKTLVAKQEKQEKVSRIFENLFQITGALDLYKVLFPTDNMREQLAKTYIGVLDLIVRVTEYCSIGRISKIVDALTSNAKYDFDEGVQRVQDSYDALKTLVQNASYAMQKDMFELLNDQAAIVDYIAEQSLTMASNITSLSHTLENLQLNQSKIHSVQVRAWSDALINIMLPSTYTTWEELQLWQSREFRLSPKDHWEGNGMLDHLEEWNELPYASILAIFGPTRDRDSWVTEFSLDTIQAFQVQNELATFALCDRPGDKHYTPAVVIKKLICQLLEQRPRLILKEPEIFNTRVFQRVQNFDQACSIFKHIVARLDKVAILIDRVDCCQGDPNDPGGQNLVGYLLELVQKHGKKLKVLMTSAEEPPENLPPDLPISVCMISTQKNPSVAEYKAGCRRAIKFTLTWRDKYGIPRRRTAYGAKGALRLNPDTWKWQPDRYELGWSRRIKPRNRQEAEIYKALHLYP